MNCPICTEELKLHGEHDLFISMPIVGKPDGKVCDENLGHYECPVGHIFFCNEVSEQEKAAEQKKILRALDG